MKLLSMLRGLVFAAAALCTGMGFAQTPPAVGVPSKVVGVHFAAWETDVNIRNITQDANVLYLFNLRPHAGEVGTWYWEWPGWPSQADVQFVRARGQKVILSLGGAGFPFKFNSRAKTQATLNAIRSHIANNFGPVDGIELNTFEGEEYVPASGTYVKRAALSDPAEILWLMQQLRAEYGNDFALTIPPAPNYPEDLALATALANNGALTWAAPQFYDWSGFNAPGFISGRMRDWVNAIGQGRVVMGVSANYPDGPTLADSTREWDIIEAEFPNIRGAVAWNAQLNHRGGNQWTATMKERVIGSGGGGTPPTNNCANYSAWNSSTRYMPGDVVSRNGQLYVATAASADPTWNVNSPPEQTPSLWSTYNCTGNTTPTCATYPEWNASTRYMPGDIVTRNGQRYVATAASADPTWNVNSPPEQTPSLWSTYNCTGSGTSTPTCGTYPAWNTTTRYMPGDIVTRNGQRYVATAASADPTWNVNSPPEQTPSLWSIYNCTN